MSHHKIVLPFAAIVGQGRLKKALVLNAINPGLRGVLIKGEKGTAKSTAVRALADLLPEIEVVCDCPFNCHPTDANLQCNTCRQRRESGEELPRKKRKMRVVDLPLGATEDRVVGTLDIEKALKEGIKALQPGILADANRGILYIDEINLLDDHLVDVLLDAAAMGVNIVEREGIQVSHPSRFILVGTMNPQEGELRPQLLDRIGLQVNVEGIKDIPERMRIVEVVEEFEAAPFAFTERYLSEQEKLQEQISAAQALLPKITLPEHLLELVTKICVELGVDGHRADILIARCAKTIAAFSLQNEVTEDDVKEAASFVLPHRVKAPAFEEPPDIQQKLEEIMNPLREPERERGREGEEENHSLHTNPGEHKGKNEKTFDIGRSAKPDILPKRDKKLRIGSGKRTKTVTTRSGKYVDFRIPMENASDIALDATLRASAARGLRIVDCGLQISPSLPPIRNQRLSVQPQDLREKVRERKKAAVITFVVDASGSMGAQRRMEVAKGAVMELLAESYQKRDKVAFIAFRGQDAHLLLPPTSGIERAAQCLRELPTGGKTPLPAGLNKALEVLLNELKRDESIIPVLVLVSDGKGNVPIKEDVRKEVEALATKIRERRIHLVVIDSGGGFLRLGYNKQIAQIADGEYCNLEELNVREVVSVVRKAKE
ncbi:MAG TPA: VWA domain-containing protein [Candidatus Latescibacteria bacterium]|nr:VWA domain-containing protein [Candidatus Latescibacterota bacterium]